MVEDKMKRTKQSLQDDQDDVPDWWAAKLDKTGKRKPGLEDQFGPPSKPTFELAPHHVIVTSGYGRALIKGDPTNRKGLPVLCSPGGLPIARQHGDLKEGEVSWVLR